jgi:hypothetical protein
LDNKKDKRNKGKRLGNKKDERSNRIIRRIKRGKYRLDKKKDKRIIRMRVRIRGGSFNLISLN